MLTAAAKFPLLLSFTQLNNNQANKAIFDKFKIIIINSN